MVEAELLPGPDESSSPLDILVLCFKLHQALESLIEQRSRPFGLTATEALALHCLSSEARPVSEIAKLIGLQPNGASVLVSRLASRRLVRRQRKRSDRRVNVIALTSEGQSQAASIQLELWRNMDAFLTPLPAKARQQFNDAVRQLLS